MPMMTMASSQCKTETIFDYTWKQVVQAYWHRYPNPSSTHVLTEDTICREVRDGKLYSRRILSKTNPVPKWGSRFYNNAPVKIIEDSVIDPKGKTLITFTRNIGMKKIMKVDEIVEYSEQLDGRTLAIRRAYISSQVFGFSRAIRAFGIERFKSNCNKAANGFNYVLRNMFPNQAKALMHKTSTHALDSNANGGIVSTKSESLQHQGLIQQQQQLHQQQNHSPSTTETLKKATKIGYEYVKCQASKIVQLFSVRN